MAGLSGPVIAAPDLAALLSQHWDLPDVRVRVLGGGMGSATWLVSRDRVRWVAKAVQGGSASQLDGGLHLAQHLERAGIPAGAPVPTNGGHLTIAVGAARLALLTWVPGEALTGDDPAQRDLIGSTLARVHRALADCGTADAQRFHWVDPDAAHLTLRPWLRPAVSSALAALDVAGPSAMTWGLLHADPAPEAFRLDAATGRCGVIDWSYRLHGPLLYDLASAVMYCGGPGPARELTQAYLREGPLGIAEASHGLDAMLRFRWAVQADYFAWRITTNDLTGITGPHENEKGLEDARLALT